MAHFAELDENNKVLQVVVVNNQEILNYDGTENEQKGIDFCVNLFGGKWIQTSYNNRKRGTFAGIDFIYDPVNDIFIKPEQPIN